METPLRERSGGHIGTAPTVSFGGLRLEWLISFRWIVRKWLFCLCGIVRKDMMEIGKGGPMCPPVSPHKGASIVKFPRTMRDTQTDFWYGNAATRTFGRAHRHRPYGIVWADCVWAVDFVGGLCANGYFVYVGLRGKI